MLDPIFCVVVIPEKSSTMMAQKKLAIVHSSSFVKNLGIGLRMTKPGFFGTSLEGPCDDDWWMNT